MAPSSAASSSGAPGTPPRTPDRSRVGVPAALLAALLALPSCAPSTDPLPAPVEPPARFSQAGQAGGPAVPGRWWRAFGEPGLSAAVRDALDDNFDLLIAWERLRASRAIADRTGARLLPAVDAAADGSLRRPEEGEDGGAGEALTLDAAASYEADLWGRIGSRVEADRMRAQASLADYHAAGLSVSAEVARTWAALAEARSQVALVEEQIETNEIVLQLLENRFGLGQVRAVDLLRQRQLIEATREERVLALRDVGLLENRLAVLQGRAPAPDAGEAPGAPGGAPAPAADGLPSLPPLPATGVPLELVRRRPDVVASFRRLQAADRELAAALADRYPRLSLSASVVTTRSSASTLFRDWVAAIGGNLLAPIFYGGELAAEVDRAEAVRRERLYQYGRTTLLAFQEVEDGLVRELRQQERIQAIEDQVELAEQAWEQLRIEYFNGAADYLDVLTALEEVQVLRRDLLAQRLALVQARIGLYRALAGSFATGRETEETP